MGKDIDDGYTRHVGIGDGVGSQKVELKFRRPQGSELLDLPNRMATAQATLDYWKSLPKHKRSKKKPKGSSELANSIMADSVCYLHAEKFEGAPEINGVNPEAKTFEKLDAHAYCSVFDVVINGLPPDEVYDREDSEQAGDAEEDTAEADAKNS